MTNKSTHPKLDTKAAIIQAALKLFYEQGVHWVSFKQIADQIQISQPAVYKHFKDKDDLIVSCVLNVADSGRNFIDSLVDQQKSPSKKLQAYLEANLIWIHHNRVQGTMLLAMYYFAYINPPLKDILLLIHQQSVQRVKAQIDRGNKKQDWHIKNTGDLARSIHSLLIGEMIKVLYEGNELNVQARVKEMKKLVLELIDVAQHLKR